MKKLFGRDKSKPVKVTPKEPSPAGVEDTAAPIYAQHATFNQQHSSRPAPAEHGHGGYSISNHYAQTTARPSIDSDRWEVVEGRDDPPHKSHSHSHPQQQPLPQPPHQQQQYPSQYVPPPRALAPSREGSFSSGLPPGASPPMPSPLPRSSSPFSSASLKERDKAQQPQLLKKKQANPVVTKGILKSLDPHTIISAPPPSSQHSHGDTTAPQMRSAPSQEAVFDVVPAAQVHSAQPMETKFSMHGIDPKQSIRLVGGGLAQAAEQPRKEKKGGGLDIWERISGGKDKEREREKEKEREKDSEPREQRDHHHHHRDRERESQRDRDRDKDRDRERERNREREKDRWRDREEEGQLTRMIGFLTATSSEDWNLALDVCERASANEANAKEALRAIRREFKYGEPTAQLSAARLWAIMLWNSNTSFIQHSMSRKFLDAIEHLITSSQTSPVVRERVLDVLAAAAYATNPNGISKSDRDGFRGLWRKVKPADKPDEGVPLDRRDPMFMPPTRPPRASHQMDTPTPSPYPEGPNDMPRSPPPISQQQPRKRRSLTRNRIIPPEEDRRRLMEECNIGKGNASLLSQALLALTKPENLKKDEIIREFYAKCRSSQELIYAQIPWASAGAERSRLEKEQQEAQQIANGTALPPHVFDPDNPNDKTPEERLLDALLDANAEILQALKQYDDVEQIGREREVEYRSRKETKMDPRQLYQLDAGSYQSHGTGASSRPHSRSGSTSSSPPASIITSPPSEELGPRGGVAQPYPRQPPSPPGFASGGYGSATTIPQTLAPPPAAPHGPRSPAMSSMHSRTPSPSTPAHDQPQGAHHGFLGSNPYRSVGHALPSNDASRGEVHEDGTPVIPSEKALGKRRVVEDEEAEKPFDPDDLYYDPKNEAFNTDDSADSDQDSDSPGSRKFGHTPVHYVYDAAAERTKLRLQQANLLVNGVH